MPTIAKGSVVDEIKRGAVTAIERDRVAVLGVDDESVAVTVTL